jgi:hypothetical protein
VSEDSEWWTEGGMVRSSHAFRWSAVPPFDWEIEEVHVNEYDHAVGLLRAECKSNAIRNHDSVRSDMSIAIFFRIPRNPYRGRRRVGHSSIVPSTLALRCQTAPREVITTILLKRSPQGVTLSVCLCPQERFDAWNLAQHRDIWLTGWLAYQ